MKPILSTITIPANGAASCDTPAKVLTVKSCTLPINASMDGGSVNQIQAGAVLDGPFRTVNFLNTNATAVTLVFWIGNDAVKFSPADNAQANAATSLFGNLGVADNTGAANGFPACDVNGFLQITNAMLLTIGNTVNGHRRQAISFSVKTGAAFPLMVKDVNGFSFCDVQAGQNKEFVTDAILQVSGMGGTCPVIIGQMILTA